MRDRRRHDAALASAADQKPQRSVDASLHEEQDLQLGHREACEKIAVDEVRINHRRPQKALKQPRLFVLSLHWLRPLTLFSRQPRQPCAAIAAAPPALPAPPALRRLRRAAQAHGLRSGGGADSACQHSPADKRPARRHAKLQLRRPQATSGWRKCTTRVQPRAARAKGARGGQRATEMHSEFCCAHWQRRI